ncbi:MAG: NTP transferase domain-containing protein, partial [Syntrophothermus sp.]
MTKIDVVVLAGANNDGALKAVTDTPYEALIMLAGKPMVKYVVDAAARSKYVGRVVIVGPERQLREFLDDTAFYIAQCGETMVENILIGIEMLQPRGKVLLVTSDIPLLTPEAIDDFIERCNAAEADIYYPIVSREANDAKYPGVKRTYVRLKEGVFTGGNMALLQPQVVRKSHKMIERAVSMRKKPWQLSRLLGFKFIVKFVFNKLSLTEIEQRVQLILGFKGVGIISP